MMRSALRLSRGFGSLVQIEMARKELRDIGDKDAILETQTNLASQINTLREASSLSEKEITDYQALVDRLGTIKNRLKLIEDDTARLAPYLRKGPRRQVHRH